MSNRITVKDLAREARCLAQEFPDRIAVCSYTRYEGDELVPNCIVGTAAFNLGISLVDLYKVNTCGICHLADIDIPDWLDVSASDSKIYVSWLSNLQGAQDQRRGWGEALTIADRRLVISQFDI